MPGFEFTRAPKGRARRAALLRSVLLIGSLLLCLVASGCVSGDGRGGVMAAAPDRAPVVKGPDAIWPPLPEPAMPVIEDLSTQLPPEAGGFVSPGLRNQLLEIYDRFTLALDTSCDADTMANFFSENGRMYSPIEGSNVTGRENIRAALKSYFETLGGKAACRRRWVEEHATRRHHLALSPVFVRLGPEYVRLYSKTVVLGPDPDGLHKDQGHAIRVL
ncbi:MAG: nuclear transport factor 2 family protein, partial [bacterium]|nr:nuclear transport factor 2 family protein [bacterium]